ncbi:MAG: beta-carotene hydroxylase [Bacteroidia bacterium]|jgi:beta-carotene hydroxylase
MLKYSADIRTLIAVALYFTSTALAWLYFPESWLLRIPVVFLLCTLSFICAVIIHNTIHCPMFKARWANKVAQVVLSFTYGHSVSAYVPGHNFSHHQHTQTPLDRIRTDKMRFKWNLLNQLFFFFRMAPGIMRDENVFAARMRKERPKWFRQYVFEMALAQGTKFGLLFYNWELALPLIFIPHVYAAWGIVGTNFWQHDGCDEHHKYNHSRNFIGSTINFLAFNNGFHGAHHEVPHLHWSLLPEYHYKKISPHIHPNLEPTNLFTYLWKTCIYPAKRLDYLGMPLVLPPVKDDEDWVPVADLSKNKYALGVEGNQAS